MASSIQVPRLEYPQQTSPIQTMGDLMRLRNAQQESQLIPGQIQVQQQQLQAGQQENQMRQMQIDQAQAMMAASRDVDWSKPSAWDDFAQKAQATGKVQPQTLQQLAMQRAAFKEQLAKTDTETMKADLERNNQLMGHLDAIKSETDPARRAQAAQVQAQQILAANLVKDPRLTQQLQAMAQGQIVPNDDQLKLYENGLLDHKTQVSQALDERKAAAEEWKYDRTNGLFFNVRTKETAMPGAPMSSDAAHAVIDAIAPPQGDTAAANQRAKSVYDLFAAQGNMPMARKTIDELSQQMAATEKAVATVKAEAPTKIAIAGQETAARMNVEGRAVPVYARGADGNLVQTDRSTALANKMTDIQPVTSKQIDDDKMLVKRLSDVEQKIGEYKNATQLPLASGDAQKISALMANDKLKAGFLGIEVPVDFANQLLKARNFNELSQNAQKRMVAYANARESMAGYNRVLTGGSRSSDKTLELQMDTLPHPLYDTNAAGEHFDQFQRNLDVVGQDLPNFSHIKSPQQTRQEVNDPHTKLLQKYGFTTK